MEGWSDMKKDSPFTKEGHIQAVQEVDTGILKGIRGLNRGVRENQYMIEAQENIQTHHQDMTEKMTNKTGFILHHAQFLKI